MPSNNASPPPSRLGRFLPVGLPTLAIAATAAAALTTGLFRSGAPVSEASADCAADQLKIAALKPKAIGTVAAFTLNAAPRAVDPLSFNTPDGKAKTLADFKGRTVLLNLWATWCAPCREEMPTLDKLQQTLGTASFEVVTVNVDTRDLEKPDQFMDDIGAKTLTRYRDPKAVILQDLKRQNRAPGLPATLLIGPTGCELGFLLGPADWASDDAKSLIKAALAP